MLVEFDALDDLIAAHIDVIENVAVDNRVDTVLLPRSNTTHRTTSLVNELCFTWLYVLNHRIRVYVPGTDSTIVRTTDQRITLHV